MKKVSFAVGNVCSPEALLENVNCRTPPPLFSLTLTYLSFMQLKCIQPIESASDCRLFLFTFSFSVFKITVSNSSFCSPMLLGTMMLIKWLDANNIASLYQTRFNKILLWCQPRCWFIHLTWKRMKKRIFIHDAIIFRWYVT